MLSSKEKQKRARRAIKLLRSESLREVARSLELDAGNLHRLLNELCPEDYAQVMAKKKQQDTSLDVRVKRIQKLLKADTDLAEIAEELGLSRSRISSLCRQDEQLCQALESSKRRRKEKNTSAKIVRREKHDEKRIAKFGKSYCPRDASPKLKRSHEIFTRKRNSCRPRGIKFTITFAELDFPDVCPVLGLRLSYAKPRGSKNRVEENAPTFDRIDPSKGYISGNVLIVSWRANRIKNDGTPDEHAKIAKFYRNL